MKWNVNEEHAGLLLRDYLMNVVGISKRLLTAVKFEEGKLLVNDQEVNVRYTLKENDQIEVVFPAEKRSELLVAEDIPIDIVYEDVALLVLNKKANIVTLPSRLHPCHTLANGVIYYYDQQQITYTVHVVTRLDRDTSGLLLIAKNRYIHSILFRDQHQHTINRKYQAIVTGLLQEKKGTISCPIERDADSIIKRTVSPHGKRAITHYQVKEELNNASLVEVSLETGRTHQIRVHFSAVGHPLIGDDLYGGETTTLGRQALHCHQLAFNHPLTKERMQFNIPLATDIAQAWQRLK